MIKQSQTILILAILFSSSTQAQAQIPVPEKVCSGTDRHYWVNGLAGSTYTWKINGVMQNSTTNQIDITWSGKGVFNLEVQEHQSTCSGDVQSAVVEVNELPGISLGTITQPTCSTASGSVELRGLPAGNWLINPGNISGNTFTYTITGLAANSITNYTVTNAAGCVSANLRVLIDTQPLIPTAPVASVTAQPDCIFASGTITVTTPKPGVGITYTLTGTRPIVGTMRNSSGLFVQLSPGNYDVSILTASGCISAPTNKTINAQPAATDPIIIAESHLDIDKVNLSGSIDLTVSGGTGAGSYSFNWSNGTSTEDQTDLAVGTYSVVVTDNNKCNNATLSIRIESLYHDHECDLMIPEAFSPNGDGVHDYFQIYCFNNYPDARIYIFDQLGNKLFEKAHYGNLEFWGANESAWWCGKPDRGPVKSRNERVAPGTYYYVLNLGNGEVKKSFVFVSY